MNRFKKAIILDFTSSKLKLVRNTKYSIIYYTAFTVRYM